MLLRKFYIVVLLVLNSFSSVKSQAFKLSANINQSYDARLLGDWKVKTVVVDSNCKYVEPGIQTYTRLNFSLKNGKIRPQWFANDWDLVKDQIFELAQDDKLLWLRENKLNSRGKHWITRSKDIFDIKKREQITAKSHVNQYLNGKYVGDYQTISYLRRH